MTTGRITTGQGIGCGEGREAGRLRAVQIATELNLMGAVLWAESEWQAADMAMERGPPFLLATCVSPDHLAGGRREQADGGSLPFCPLSGSCDVSALVWPRLGVRDLAALHLPPMSSARPRRFGIGPVPRSYDVSALVWARFGVRDPAARHLPPMSRARPRRFGTCTGEATGRRGLGPSSPF